MTVTTISGTLTHGVDLGRGNYGASLTISRTGKITGPSYAIYVPTEAGINIVNDGALRGSLVAVYMAFGGTILNAGSIYGTTVGVDLKRQASMTNTGTVSGGSDYAVGLSSGSSLINANMIRGSSVGVYLQNGAVQNSGSIFGGKLGIDMAGGALLNSGTISGNTIGLYMSGYPGRTNQPSYVTNSAGGQITGGAAGVVLHPFANAAMTLTNAGAIFGQTVGVYLSAGNLNNGGVITSNTVGVYLESGNVTNSGTIAGGIVGVYLYGGALTNNAVISGSSYAVYSHNSLALTIGTGAVFDGKVLDKSGNGKLNLAGTGGLPGLGTKITGFSTFDFLAGAGWTLQGNVAALAGGEVFNGFTAGDAIILQSFAATSQTLTQAGLLLSNGGVTETVALAGAVYPSNFAVSNDGANTTIQFARITSLDPITTISTSLVQHVTLGSGYFASQVAITNTGSVILPDVVAVYLKSGNERLTNAGSVSGEYVGVELYGGATVDNTSVITGRYLAGVESYGGAITNSGTIEGGVYGVLGRLNTTIQNAGTIEGGGDGIRVSSATIINSGKISGSGDAIFAGEDVGGTGLVLVVEPGAEFEGKVVALNGAMTLAGSTAGVLDIGSSFTGFNDIDFAAGSNWRLEGAASALAADQTINGFAYTDTILVDNFVVDGTATSYVSGTGLELTDTAGQQITLDITGDFSTANFDIAATDGAASIEIAVCYLRGTRILTAAGEVPVESLNIGDAVITKFGGYRPVKWIGRQSYARRFVRNNFEQIPVRIKKGALGDGLPVRDLWVSPGHSMLIGGVLVLTKCLVNGVTITQDFCPPQIDYFQIEFETHNCVLAEGAWSESYADTPGFRNKFHNAADFYQLYPDHVPPDVQTLCAPRPLQGPALEDALRPIVANAAAGVRPGKLYGVIDEISMDGIIRGWARDEENPHLPVLMEILVCGQVIGTVLACESRADLKDAGMGRGRCGFSFVSRLGLPAGVEPYVQIRRAEDHAAPVMRTSKFASARKSKAVAV